MVEYHENENQPCRDGDGGLEEYSGDAEMLTRSMTSREIDHT